MTRLLPIPKEVAVTVVMHSLRTVQKWLNEETGHVPRSEIAYVCAALEGVMPLLGENKLEEKKDETG